MRIQEANLVNLVTRIFVHSGTPANIAEQVARHLVTANLKGHDSHGVGMIPTYLYGIQAGNLNPNAHAKIVKDQGSVMLVDGGTGFGQVVGREATELAIERVKENGLVCMGVRNCHHLGRIGAYGELCGAAGLISIHFVNVVGHDPQVSPFAGRERRMTTNPFCCVVPREGQEPIVLDMATSTIALGKVRVANMKGEKVPAGALLDHEGLPTQDPGVMYSEPMGSLAPFGAHKGYGLAVMCELLGGALVGEWTAQPKNPRKNTIINNMLMFVLDPTAFGTEKFADEVREMTDYLHNTTPSKGHDRVRVPGDPERETRTTRRRDGIDIDANSWGEIVSAAVAIGMEERDIVALAN